MNRPVALAATLAAALVTAAGCADLLGLEPAVLGSGGSAGQGGSGGLTTTGSGGSGGAAPTECKSEDTCPVAGLPACTKPTCVDHKCDSAPAADGETIPCYTGKSDTQDVGLCHAGTKTCVGGVQSECLGEVTPAAVDNCMLEGDENCDGVTQGCPGELLEAVQFEGGGNNDLRGVAYDAAGNLYVTGTYGTPTVFAGCPLPFVDGGTVASFVARLSPELECEWAARLGSSGTLAELAQVAVKDGRVWVAGSVHGPEAALVDGAGDQEKLDVGLDADALAVALDATTGGLLEAFLIGGGLDDYGTAVALGAKAYVTVQGGAGEIRSVKSGDKVVYATAGEYPDALVLQVDLVALLAGWSLNIPGMLADAPRALALADDDTQLLVGGTLSAKAVISNACALEVPDMPRAFLLGVEASNGAYVAGECRTEGTSMGPALTVGLTGAADGRFAAAGYATGIGNISCGGAITGNNRNAWLMVGTTTGSCTKTIALHDPIDAVGVQAAFLGNGSTDVLFLASYNGELAGTTSNKRDAVLVRYPADLSSPIWSTSFGSDEEDNGSAMAVHPNGTEAVVVGSCTGKFFGGKFDCKGVDGFLARIAL